MSTVKCSYVPSGDIFSGVFGDVRIGPTWAVWWHLELACGNNSGMLEAAAGNSLLPSTSDTIDFKKKGGDLKIFNTYWCSVKYWSYLDEIITQCPTILRMVLFCSQNECSALKAKQDIVREKEKTWVIFSANNFHPNYSIVLPLQVYSSCLCWSKATLETCRLLVQ